MLARLQSLHAHPSMIGDRRIDMDEIHFRILEDLVEFSIPFRNAEPVTHLVQILFVPTADGDHIGVGMPLVNWDEFGAETETNHSDIEFLLRHF